MSEKAPKPEITPENKDRELAFDGTDRQWAMDPTSGEIIVKDSGEKLAEWHGEQIDKDNR